MKQISLSVLLITLTLSTSAQNKTILLYPDGAPGLISTPIPENSKTSDGITRVNDITEPALYYFQPVVKTTDAAVIICPGGGYSILAIDHEGYEIAEWFSARGVTAFVLKSRLPQANLFENASIRPLQDAQQSFRIVRSKAVEFGISPDKIGIMGFSAGGHLASTASTHFEKQVGEIIDTNVSVRPDFSILIYPVITFSALNTHSGSRENLIGKNPSGDQIEYYSNEKHVTAATPPAFLISTADDWVSPENSILYFDACRRNKVLVEMHIYEKGGHGFALKKKGSGPVESWPLRLEDWMKEHMWIK